MQEVERRFRLFAWLGFALMLGALLLVVLDGRVALAGWLCAFLFVSGVPIGALFLTLLLELIPGKWQDLLLPAGRSLMALMPLTLVAVLPVLFGAGTLYRWGDGGFNSAYLNVPFFATRGLVALAAACGLVWLLRARSPAGGGVAAAGVIGFMLLHGILSTDWIVSLHPRFHSSGFALYFLSVQAVIALALMSLLVLATETEPRRVRILGALMLAALLLWAYFAFMQYLILWSGNLPDGAEWYNRHAAGGWMLAEYGLSALQLGCILALMFSPVRRSPRYLRLVLAAVLLGKAMETAWLVLPELNSGLAIALAAALLSVAGMTLVLPAALGRFRVPAERLASARPQETPS